MSRAHTWWLAHLSLAATVAAPQLASAQPNTPYPLPAEAPPTSVDPSPRTPAQPATPTTAPPATPPPSDTTTAQPAGQSGDAAADTGFYHTDDYGDLTGDSEPLGGGVRVHGGSVPSVHTVRRGDTLWDISWFYFSSPWEWPKVWSYNPEITNPHWIYPGDQIRLYPAGEQPVATTGTPDDTTGGTGDTGVDRPAPQTGRDDTGDVELRQLAFVDQEDRDRVMEIDGSPDEKLMLAEGDEVYVKYPKGKPPKVGQRYSIYREKRTVKHPEEGHEVGSYVEIRGDLEVISVMEGKRARAVILSSTDVIERGMKVGPLVKQFKDVDPVAAKKDLTGTIVAQLESEVLIGARQVVFIDRGASHGVEVGNVMHVIRRGDAYQKLMGPRGNVGKNDERYPARSIGKIMVVDTGKASSVAVVVDSEQELGVGDHVVMLRPKP